MHGHGRKGAHVSCGGGFQNGGCRTAACVVAHVRPSYCSYEGGIARSPYLPDGGARFDGFTVNDLCQRAGLNRGTFYNHFEDKDCLLQTFENEVLRGLAVFQEKMSALSIKDLMGYLVTKKPFPVLVELFDYLREEGDFLHAVLGPGGDVRFGPRLREAVCSQFIMSLLHEQYRENPTPFVNYYIAYYAGAYLGFIGHWVETGMKESSEEMALIAMKLLFIKPGEPITM